MKKKANINRQTILNILSVLILQSIVFITTPIFTRLLGASQFGMFSVFNSWVMIFTCLMGFGMHSTLGTGMYSFGSEYKDYRNSTLVLSSIICMIEFLIVFIFKDFLSNLLGFDNILILAIGVTSIGHYIISFAQNAFIFEKKAMHNFILSVSLSIMTVIISIFLILFLDYNERYLGRIAGSVIPYILIGIFVWILLFHEKPIFPQNKYVKYAFTVGFPIVFHALSQNILGQSDRVMMQSMRIDSIQIGIYSLFYSLSSILSTILNALNNSWCPFYYDYISKNDWKNINTKTRNYIELFTVLSVGFLLLSKEVTYIMADKSYWNGINIIPILVFSIYFMFMYQFFVNFEFFHKKTKIIAFGTISSGLLNILLNLIFIPKFGMYGAAIATAISYFSLFVAHAFLVKKVLKLKFSLNIKIFIPYIFQLLLASFLFYFLSDYMYIRWVIGIIIGTVELYRIYKRKSIF